MAQNVRNLGNKTFYHRSSDERWVDSTVNETLEKQAISVKQFSDEYFKLAEKFGRELAQYLVYDVPVLVNLNGQAYLIDPPSR